jgi:hypothetical protein
VPGGYIPSASPFAQPPSYPPPPAPPSHKRIPTVLLVVLAALALVILTVAGVVVRSQNLLPAGVPVLGMDSGVAVCKAIHEKKKPAPATVGDELTQVEYREFRQVFADSRYPAIRDNGVKLIDNVWQIQAIPEGEEMGALAYVGALTSAYAGLSGGCAEVGYAIPPLGAS